MRTTFTSGAWVEHVPIQDLKGKHKRDLARAGRPTPVYRDGELDKEATMSGLDVVTWLEARRDAAWAMIVEGWSYDLPVPELGYDGLVADLTSFGELPLEDYEELERLMTPFIEKLTSSPDPKGATTSSSNGSSRAKAAASPKG
jgi:hypothetical protein